MCFRVRVRIFTGSGNSNIILKAYLIIKNPNTNPKTPYDPVLFLECGFGICGFAMFAKYELFTTFKAARDYFLQRMNGISFSM